MIKTTYHKETVKKEAVEIYNRLRVKYAEHIDARDIMFDIISSALLILIMNSTVPKHSDIVLAHINDLFKKAFEENIKSGAWYNNTNAASSTED